MKATGIVRRIDAGVIISLRSKNRGKSRGSADFIQTFTMDTEVELVWPRSVAGGSLRPLIRRNLNERIHITPAYTIPRSNCGSSRNSL